MSTQKEVVVVAGAGNIASYLAEEFIHDGKYQLVIVSRGDQSFFEKLGVTCHKVGAYSKEEILPVLDRYKTRALVSTIHTDDANVFTSVHKNMLEACRESKTCKHYMPSEYIGNLRTGSSAPRGLSRARSEFRALIAKETEINWTLINQGWLADYFVQPPDGSKSYIAPFPAGWPIDMEKKTVRLIGSGNEAIGWTAARDVAKAVVKLVAYDSWPDHTYVFGELGTWNEAIEKVERFHGVKLERVPRSKEDIDAALAQEEDHARWYTATMDEWSLIGATAVPKDEALEAREKYFKDVHFRNIEELLRDGQKPGYL